MKKKNIFFIFLILIFAGVLFYLVYRKIGTEKIWQSLLSFSPIGILVVFLMMIISHIIGILRWQIILKDKGYHFEFKELILPWFVNFGITFFAPFAFAGAETMRASIVKEKKKEARWKKVLSSVFIDKLFEGTTSILMIFLGILSLVFYSVNLSYKMWLFFLFLMIPILGVGYFYFKAFNSQSIAKFAEKPLRKIFNHRAESIFQIEEEIFNFLDKNNKNFKEAFFLAILRQVFDFLACFFILFFMGANLNILQSIAVIGFIYISFYIIPVPAAIGILEIIQAVIFNHFGFAPQLGAAFSLLYRAFFFVFAFLGIVFSFRVILRWMGKSISEMVKENNK
jgi:uncharacterized protein (TIRG00374 family)